MISQFTTPGVGLTNAPFRRVMYDDVMGRRHGALGDVLRHEEEIDEVRSRNHRIYNCAWFRIR